MTNEELSAFEANLSNCSDIELAMEYSDVVYECSELRDDEIELLSDSNSYYWNAEQDEKHGELMDEIHECFCKMSVMRREICRRFKKTH